MLMHMMADSEQALVAIRRERENLAWINKSMADLRKKFGDHYIAVKDRKVIDYGTDFADLLARVRKLPDAESVTIEFVTALELIWML